MSVSIQVAIRCRPFAFRNELGVSLYQNSENEGEVNLLNSRYTQNTRWAFTYSWWSGYNYQNYLAKPNSEADKMELISQEKVYNIIGPKIKKQLLDGSAVVLFAYGLSGSGKTYTVFGPTSSSQSTLSLSTSVSNFWNQSLGRCKGYRAPDSYHLSNRYKIFFASVLSLFL